MSTYAAAAAALPGDQFGIGALRRRSVRYWLAAVGLFGIGSFYVTPTIAALRMPQTQTPLPAMNLPLIRFAPFSIPKLHKAPAAPPVPKAVAAARTLRHAPVTRAPVVMSTHTLVAPAPKPEPAAPAADPLASAPTIESGVGVVVAIPDASPPAVSPPQPAADPATDPATVVPPTGVTRQVRMTQSAAPPPPVAAPAAAPVVVNDTFVPADPPTVTPGDVAPVDPVVPVAPVTIPAPDTVQITAPAETDVALPSAAPAQPDQTLAVGSTPTQADLVGAPPVGAISSDDGATVGPDPGPADASAAPSDADLPAPDGADLPSADPAAVPGSGPSPPAAVSILTTGASTWTLDGSGGVTVTSDGLAPQTFANVTSISAGGSDDTLVGPAFDTTWSIDGADSGVVDGISFSGFEHLLGAPDNSDTFVFGPSGSSSGGIDGGAGGFDTVVIDGGSFAHVGFTTSGPDSGTVTRDGDTIAYAGLEPITDSTAGSKSFSGTGGADTITISDTGTSSDGSFQITSSTGEGVLFDGIASSIDSLTIDALGGNDTVHFTSIDSTFTGTITVHGGAGTDTFVAPDLPGAWDLSGIGAGTYRATGGPLVTFDGFENLTGAPTQADSFDFETGGAVTGTIDSGSGTLTVEAAGFIQVSGSYSFVQQSFTGSYSGTTSGTVTGGNALTIGGTSGTGLVGINAFGNPLGLQGTLTSFGLAIVTDGTNAWSLFQGTISNPQFVGFGGELSAGLSNLTVQVNTGSNGTYLNTHGAPITAGPVSLDYTTGVIAASTTFSLTISDFVHLSGTFTIGLGLGTTVNVATGLDSGDADTTAPGLSSLTSLGSSCTGTSLGRTDDDSMICNLPVNALQISASNITVFVGYASGLNPTGPSGTLLRTDVPDDAIGLYANDINVGLVLMSAKPTTNVALDALGLKFYALKASAGDVEILGIPDVTLSATNITVKVNSGKAWALDPTAQAPVVDFSSFGSGYTIAAGPNPPIVVDYTGPIVGASADQVLFQVSDFVYVSGGFNISKGPVQNVDVKTGLTLASAAKDALFGTISTSATKPSDGSLAVTDDGSEIWNLPVSTLEIGFSNVTVFVGYADSLALDPATQTLDETALDAANAIGLFLGGGDLGMTLMRVLPVLEAPALTADQLKFFALKADADNLALIGVPDLTLSAASVQVRVNRGSTLPDWPGTLLETPPPVVDFISSFPTSGLELATDSSGTHTVTLDYTDPVVGASADKVLFQVSDFVYIAGSFSFSKGPVVDVDVKTGISGLAAQTVEAGLAISDTDPTDGSIARTTDGSEIWNLPVQTLNIGIGHADLFVGYADGLSAGADGSLTEADIDAVGGIGLLLHDVTVGFVLMRALPVPTSPSLTAATLKFFSLKADAGDVALIGVPDLTLNGQQIEVRVNQGSGGADWPGNEIPGTSPPVVDFVSSFPGDGGYQINTSTAGPPVVLLDYTDPKIGASADHVLFQVSDFVYIAGSFSFDKGAEVKVDVKTGLTQAQATSAGLFTGLTKSDTKPSDGSLAITNDGSTIWNLPVQALQVGVANGNVFVGYSTGVTLDSSGNIDVASLEANGAIGLVVSNVAFGLAMLRAPPITSAPGLTAAKLSFFALKADADNVALLGIPDLTLQATGVEIRVNQGSTSPDWPGKLTNSPPPIVDFTSSFGSGGYQVATSTTGTPPPVSLTYDQPTIGASANGVLFQVSSFVYISGSFNFDKGPVQKVDVETGLSASSALVATTFASLPISATKPSDGSTAITADGSEIWNLPVSTIQIGFSDVNVFVGYSTGIPALDSGGLLQESGLQDPVGLFLQNVDLGMVLMKALPVSVGNVPIVALTESNLSFFALKADASIVALLGIPDFTFTTTNLEVRVNSGKGTFPPDLTTPGTTPAPPVIDFQSSFGPDGYQVPTDTAGLHPVALTYTSPVIGASADNVLLQISDFVYVSGGFSFDKGPVNYVDVKTHLPSIEAETLLAQLPVYADDPGGTTLGRTSDGSEIWNLPVSTIEVGFSNVNVFVGYSTGLTNDPVTGAIDPQNGIGLLLQNVDLGLVVMKALPVSVGLAPVEGINGGNLKFFALTADAATIALVGVPDLTLSATNLEVRVNNGEASGDWVTIPAGGSAPPPPVIDFQASFPDTNGYQVRTDTSGLHPVTIDYSDPEIGASADHVVLQISQFVYVMGGFSFDKGPVNYVDVATGFTLAAQGETAIGGLTASDTDPGGQTLGRKSDNSMIWNLPVSTIQIGLRNVYVFAGYTSSPIDIVDGAFTTTDLNNAGAIGVELQNVNLGLVLMNEVSSGIPLTAGTLGEANLRFFALQASADSLGLIGVPAIQLNATGASVSVNQGEFEEGAWPAIPGTSTEPVIDFQQSFPDTSGYQVPTDTSGDFELLDFTTPLIAGGAQRFTIQISSFVYLTGSIYFQKGGQLDAPLTGGVLGDPGAILNELGLPPSITDDLQLTHATMNTMTIGAANVEAFVGVNGPYWTQTIPDRDSNGQIVASEVNHSAIGLLIDNVNFGMFIGTPTIPGDPIRYVALKATASEVAFVGVDGLTAEAENIDIEVNISSPTLEGLPVLPVINFSALPLGYFPVRTGALNPDGTPQTINMDFSTALIRARSSWIQLDIFGVVDVQGSIAFNLGPQETVTLENGTVETLTTMTIGAAHVSAFVGFDGPYITDQAGDVNSSAVGLSIDNLNLGLFIGIDTSDVNASAFIALSLDVQQFHAVNIPGITLDGTLDVQLNLGAGLLSGGSAINFAASFPVSSSHPTEGFAVDTGDPSSPVVLDYTGFLVNVDVAGTLSLFNVFSIAGIFVLQADTAGLKVFAAGSMKLGPDIGRNGSALLDIEALGVFIMNSQGVAADIDVSLSLGISALGLNVTARVILNTTGHDQSIDIPQRLLDLINSDAAGGTDAADAALAATLHSRLTTCGDGSQCYVVHGGAPSIFTNGAPNLTYVGILLGQTSGTVSYEAPGTYLVVVMSGSFNFLNFATASGYGAVEIRSNAFQMVASLNFTIGPLSFSVNGSLDIETYGVQAHLSVSFDVNLLSLFQLNVNGTLDINTQNGNDYFQLNLSGSLSVLSIINLSGGLQVVVNHSKWSVSIPSSNPLTASFGPLSMHAYGSFNSDGDFNFHFDGGITLGSSSTGVSGTGFADASFDHTTGHFHFDVGGGLSANFAGVTLAGVSASGGIDGYLGQSVSLYMTVTGTGLFLQTVYEIVRMTADAAEDAGYAVYNFLGSIGCSISNFFDPGSCPDWVDAEVPTQELLPSTPSFTLYVTTFTLPSSLTNVVTPPPPPNLASVNTSTGVMTLNVGSLAGNRNVGQGNPNEAYEISYAGAGSAGSSNLNVTAFGVSVVYNNVRSISADFGDGTDTLVVDAGVNVPAIINGGSGDDSLTYVGSSYAQLSGGDGNDTLTLGPSVSGGPSLMLLDGGTGNDVLSNDSSSGATITGDDGNDTIYGGPGNDTIHGGNGNDTLNGGGGVDTITGDAGDDLLQQPISQLGNGSTFDGGANATAVGDIVDLTGSTSVDNYVVTVSGSTITVARVSGSTTTNSVQITTTENITLTSGGGGDSFSATGFLDQEGLKQLTIDLGSNGHAGADSVTENLSSGNDTATLSTSTAVVNGVTASATSISWTGHYRLSTVNSSASQDSLTINALAGNDIINGSAVTDVVWAHLNLNGGDGNDTIAGTLGNDTIDGGTGVDLLSGAGGTDTFADEGTGTTLAEIGAYDYGLYGNLFLMGTAVVTGSGETRTVTGFTGATVENPAVFSRAILIGSSGSEANTFALGSQAGTVTANGTVYGVTPWTGYAELNGAAGNDQYVIELNGISGANVDVLESDDVFPASGTDTLTIKGTDNADTGHAAIGPVELGLATTTFTLDDAAVSPSTINVSGRLEAVGAYLRGGNDTFAVQSLNLAGLTLDAGSGNDSILVGSNGNETTETNTGGTLNGIGSPLTVSGGSAGTDMLALDDSGDTAPNSGTLTSTALTGLGLSAAGIAYSSFDTVTLGLGSGNDTFSVTSTISGSTTVSANGGDDTIDLSGLSGTVVLNGGDGNDTITVHSTNAGSSLTVDDGNGDDWVAILAATGSVAVNGGAGNDVVEIGSNGAATPRGVDTGGNVNAVLGAISVDGGTGSDSLYLDETGDASSTGNDGQLTASTITGLGLGAGIGYGALDLVQIALGGGGTEFAVQSTSTQSTIDTGGGNDTIDVSSDAPANLGTLGQLLGHLTIDGQGGGTDTLNISDIGDAVAGSGRLTSTDFTGFGTAGISYAGVESLNVQLGQGSDELDITSTYLSAVTTIRAGPGSDTVDVSSDAPTDLGTVGGIAGRLIVDGQTGAGDTLNVSDAGDAVAQSGNLTSTLLTGLGLGPAGITYSNLEVLNIVLGSGGDTFTIASTHTGLTTLAAEAGNDTVDVWTVSGHTTVDTGTGADTVVVGSPAGFLDGMSALLELEGGSASDSFTAIDAGDATDNTGTLTSDFLSGLGMAAGIHYTDFELVTVDLGSGNDAFTVLSTDAGTTTVNGGPGNDAIDVETISGLTFVNGQAGDDSITVNGDTVSPSTANGIGALLTLDGGAGSDTYLVNTFGNGDSTIVVSDTGFDGGVNTLTINGTPAADQFLFRAGLVASLTGLVGGAYTHAELVEYDGQITGGLTVNGLGGDDGFALDDNSAVTTVNGGDGADVFQVGQLFGRPELFVTSVDLTTTTRGDLSNGISFATTLNGGDGNDSFSIFHNRAPLSTNGDAGDDTFVIRTFAAVDDFTTLNSGTGADVVQYVENAPLSIDGGDGFDTVLVIGTEFDDSFTITADGVTGSGLEVSIVNVERVTIDGVEGNDHFTVLSTAATVDTWIYGGLGSDTVDAGDPVLGTAGIQGALHVFGGDDPNGTPLFPAPVLLPGESTGPLPVPSNPNFLMIESHQVDTLNVNDGGVGAGQFGTLTSSSVTGLGMGAVGIVYFDLEAVNVHLGSGGDTFTIVSTHGGTTTLSGGDGGDALSVFSIAGPTLVAGDGGDDTITVGSPTATLTGIASLLAVDGGTGSDRLVVNDSGETADSLGTLTQTSLTGLGMAGAGSVAVYSVDPHGAGFTIALSGFGSASFASGADAATVQAGLQQLMFPAVSCGSAGTSRCSQSVFVWQLGGELLVGFQGEVAGAAPALTSTGTDLARGNGVDYANVEYLDISLGSGNDRFNVRGTLAVTNLGTGAGDDVVYVSDAADLGSLPAALASETGDLAALQAQVLYGTVTVDDLVFHGSLGLIEGALSIDAGTGSNTLGISDRADTAPRTATLTSSSLVGLAPAPIAYGASGGDLAGEGFWALQSDSGLFGRGINVYGGSGGNAFKVTSVLTSDVTPAPFGETVTSLFTGEGNDTVSLLVTAGPAQALMVDGQGGNDSINGPGSTLPLVVFGGDGADAIAGGSADDTLFGDTGRVEYLRPAGEGGYDVVLGGAPIAAYHSAPAAPDGDFLTADIVYTDASSAAGADAISGGDGNDVILGGPSGDSIDAGAGNDIVLGDNGRVVFDPALPILVQTQQPGSGGDDTIAGGLGDDVLFGGAGSDTITDTGGRNVVLGDNGYVSWATVGGVYEIVAVSATDKGTGGADTITITGAGANFVIGGTGGDTISTGPSDDLIFGDYGSITGAIPAVNLPDGPAAYTYTSIFTGAGDGGGDDVISAGDGRNVVIGGQGGDTIRSGSGDDDLVGGSNVAGAADGSDRIDGGAGNDVIAGDNALILRRGDTISLRDRTLTAATIYTIDPSGNIVPNIGSAGQPDPNGVAGRTIVLFDSGTADPTAYGNDYLAGGAGDDAIFGQMGNDVIQGDGSIDLAVGSFAAPGASVEDYAGPGTDGNDYVEGGGGSDLIFGGLGQDDLIGGSSPLYLPAGAPRPDGADVIFGGAGTDIGLNDPGDASGNGHSRDADVIVGDNGAIYRLVGSNGQFLSFGYDNYAGETQPIVPRAVQLIDYSPTGDAAYATCDPTDPDDCWIVTNAHPANIGGGDTLHGEDGNDVVYGETGSDTLFGDGQDDQLYGNSGGDWISGGTGDDGVLGDDGLLEVARNGVAEPLYGLAATTQLILGTGDEDSDDIVVTVNVTGRLNYTAIEQPFFVGGNDVIYGGLGNDFLHGGGGDDAMSGAEALPLYYDNGRNPIGVLASLAAYYTVGNVLGYSSATQSFRYFDPSDPFEKIMVAPGIDFLLNFVSATTFDATTPQTVVDDGQDVLFGDGGNDWLVGGSNEDVMFGGYGNDLLNADDNLDSTRVDVPVTYSSLCSLVTSYSSSGHEASELCEELSDIQWSDAHYRSYDPTHDIDEWAEWVTDDIDCVFTADEAATLIRFAQALKPGYDPRANDTVDPRSTGPTNADLAFGGAGHDILIANTVGDRLVDYEDGFNSYYYPWEGNCGPTVTDDNSDDVVQLLYDASLALGADPTRPEAPSSWHYQPDPSYRNGEPFGELGLLEPGDEDWGEEAAGHGWWWPSWYGGTNPCIDPEGHPDYGSLGTIVLKTPSAHPQAIERIWGVDDTAESLLNRIVVRGQLTAAEGAGLSAANLEALADLICAGLVVKVGGIWVPTNETWYDLHLADPPVITDVDWSGKLTPTTPITVSGTGDATDTVTIYWDGTHAVGTGVVGADGTWSIAVLVPVGWHDLTATQTVNALPHAGLTSGQSCDVDVTVYPDPPKITFTSTPGPTTSSTPVTVSGTGDAGDTIALYDGSRYLGSATVSAAGAWTLTVSLSVGGHSLTATQTWSGRLTSNGSVPATVTVYAPPPAPSISTLPTGSLSPVTVSGSGVAGDTVTLYEGSTVLGAALVGPGGSWSLVVTLGLGKHTFTAKQTDPVSGFTGNASASASTTVYAQPAAPTITSVSTPAATKTTSPVTVTGTGIAADKITLYDGSTAIGTATVASNGTWSLTVQLAVGVHSLSATQTLVAAVTSVASAAVSVTVYPPPPAAPSIGASATATTSSSVTLSGSGVARDTITLYDGTAAIGTAVVAPNGSWSLVATLALGSHALSATQTDPVWHLTSVKSSTVTVTVYAPPPPPVISSFAVGTVSHGSANVTFSGTGVAGEAITLYDGSTAVCTVTVASNGTWSLSVKLASGAHTITATQTLVAGVTSTASAPVTVTVPSH